MYNFTLIKLSLFLIIGILLGFYLNVSPLILLVVGCLLVLLFTASYLHAKSKFQQNPILGVLAYCLFAYLGFLTVYTHNPQNNPEHYVNLDKTVPEYAPDILVAEVTEVLKPGLYNDRYLLKVQRFNGINAEGKTLLNLFRDLHAPQLKIGQRLALNGELEDINGNLNPYQFDYSRYMKTLGVYKQMNISPESLKVLPNPENSIIYYAGKFRDEITKNLKSQDFSKDELAVIQALLLGQRQELSPEIQKSYAAAGVIHILAVSGLHVGIILFMLNWLLNFLNSWKYGKTIKTWILLIALWGFALIAGLSPSVVRAVSMFSFVAIGMQLNKRTSILNTLFASLFILLLINPFYIFQVGFQLSYSAVFAIVVFQPVIMKIINTDHRITRYFWKIISVTLAAQIGVLPLSLFYFHQFPGLFLVSNILILPFMGMILAVGVMLIILLLMGLLPSVLAWIYGGMISLLNKVVSFIASIDVLVVEGISFSLLACMAFYFFLISISFLLKKNSYTNLALSLLGIIIIQSVFIYEKKGATLDEFVIFHKTRSTHIGISGNGTFTHHSSNKEDKPQFVRDYEVGKGLKNGHEKPLKNVYTFAEKDILVIDSLGIYDISGLDPKLILLTNSPKINLERLLKKLHPELVIADGSNYKNMVERWQETALKQKIPFHATAEKGAFILNHQ